MTEQEFYRQYWLTEKGLTADVKLLALTTPMSIILERLQQVGQTQTLAQVVEYLDRDTPQEIKALASLEELTSEASLLALEREGYVVSEDDLSRPRERYINMPEPREVTPESNLRFFLTPDGKVAQFRGREVGLDREILLALVNHFGAPGFGINRLRARLHVTTGVLTSREDLIAAVQGLEKRGLVVSQQHTSPNPAESSADEHSWDIWSEGYSATGESGTAQKMNESPVKAASFDEAVAKYAQSQTDPSLFKMVGGVGWTYWGCKLFPTERQARVDFG